MEKKKVLIVEDHNIYRKALRALINQDGRFDVAADTDTGETAVTLALLHQPDVVLMDIKLPGVSGCEATRTITRSMSGAKIIALSLFDDKERIEEIIASGAVAYISKQSSLDTILSVIQQVCNQSDLMCEKR
jgi:DNA-binding NarL/FixJ family response regulator